MENYLRRAPQQGTLPPTTSTTSTSKRARTANCWDEVTIVRREGTNTVVNCNHCSKRDWKTSATRLRAHLAHIAGDGVAGGTGVPDPIKAQYSNSRSAASTSAPQQQSLEGAICSQGLACGACGTHLPEPPEQDVKNTFGLRPNVLYAYRLQTYSTRVTYFQTMLKTDQVKHTSHI